MFSSSHTHNTPASLVSPKTFHVFAVPVTGFTCASMAFTRVSRAVKFLFVLLLVVVSVLVLRWADEPVFAAMAAREAALQGASANQQQLLGVRLANFLWRRSWLGPLRPRQVPEHSVACPANAPSLLEHLPLLGRVVASRRHQRYVACMEELLQQGTEAAARWYLLCVACCLMGILLLQLLGRRLRGGRGASAPPLPPEEPPQRSVSPASLKLLEDRLSGLLRHGCAKSPAPGTPPAHCPSDVFSRLHSTVSLMEEFTGSPDKPCSFRATWASSLKEGQVVVLDHTKVNWAAGSTWVLDLQEKQEEEVEKEEEEREQAWGMKDSLRRRVPFLTVQQLDEALENAEELDSGSYGTVYLAVYEGELAAVKAMRPHTSVALLLQEARLLQELDGAGGMPRVLAVCLAPPTLVLQYVGHTYDKFLAGCSVGGLVDSLASIAGRLAELHAHGVVHNDLKVNNITFTGTFDDPVFHIIDCGLACRSGQVANCYVREGEEARYPWVAPEVGRQEPVFPSGDAFSLGVLMTQALQLLGDAQPGVASQLQQLSAACTTREPSSRPPVAMVAAALRVLWKVLSPSASIQTRDEEPKERKKITF